MDGNVPKQAGNDHPTSIPTGVFATSDGFINIACAGQHIWLRLKEELADERMDHEDYADQPSRVTAGRRNPHDPSVRRQALP